MAKNSLRKIERISRIILVAVSLVFALFLTLIGTRILADLGEWNAEPARESFLDRAKLDTRQAALDRFDAEQQFAEDSLSSDRKAQENAETRYREEKDSYDNWITTRKALKDSAQDAIVLEKTRRLDSLKNEVLAAKEKVASGEGSLESRQKERAAIQNDIEAINRMGDKAWSMALSRYNLKIFAIRLLFILPLMGLAVFLVIRFRKSRFSPFIWGWCLFVAWAFFFGLVPWLPSFGGYVQYGVGVILTVVIGYYVIRYLQRYLADKQAEVQLSSEERSRRIEEAAALRSWTSHTCPSCEHDWQSGITEKDTLPGFCIHCGLALFAPCPQCGKIGFVHFPFCWSCGKSVKTKE